ncbi:acetyl-CoA carboxylase biotin carboxyl carrier protein [Effusibacillus consociatus]|uniref:Biotin carboxyl carrier protein of acetyl-CoA carboxylase n=1 Tax=Effusibacillus consociatus TaxID=1117041 RepID=A0ABV9Q2D7_9BACL
MLKLNEIRELVRLIDETSVTELNLEAAGTKLVIKKELSVAAPLVIPSVNAEYTTSSPINPVVVTPAETPVTVEKVTKKKADTPVEDPTLHKIVSPMVGTFYQASAPDAEPFVKVGSKVTDKTVVCILEAMKLMNEIEADVRGEIAAVLVQDGEMVEYGQPLFLVKVD